MIVDSCDSRKDRARSLHDALAGPIKSDGHPAVTPRRWHNDLAPSGRLATCQQFPDGYILVIISCFLFHFNICLQVMSLIPPLSETQYRPSSVC